MQPTTPEAGPLTRVRLDVSYDGGEFSGWAVQPSRRTVQGELETALATILRVPAVALTVAGRTDAGVHASGQVAHCDLPASLLEDVVGASTGRWAAGLLRRVNRVLTPDVRVTAVREVPAEFDARFGALWRRYEYRLCDAPTGVEPLLRRHVVAWPRALDVPAMDAAAAHLVGLHDFAAFCRRREGATTVRAVQQFAVRREQHRITVGIRADAFCHSMVRSLVGALLAVGEGRKGPEWPASLLASTQRANGVSVAPALGLSLVEVAYPPDAELAARSQQTRARRD